MWKLHVRMNGNTCFVTSFCLRKILIIVPLKVNKTDVLLIFSPYFLFCSDSFSGWKLKI